MTDSSDSSFSSTSSTIQSDSPTKAANGVTISSEGITASVSSTGRQFVTKQTTGQLSIRFIPQKSDTSPRRDTTE
jgi:hypothetical protein